MEYAVERILEAKTVTAASPMAPACGLYLGRVKYDLPWLYRDKQGASLIKNSDQHWKFVLRLDWILSTDINMFYVQIVEH